HAPPRSPAERARQYRRQRACPPYPGRYGRCPVDRGLLGPPLRGLPHSMIPRLWRIYHDPKISHAFANFKIAAGIDTGSHEGPPFHDGDFFKLLEAVAAVYAITKDHSLDSMMDEAIAVIAACQRGDGYLSTPALIEERNHPGKETAFEDRLNFETY